MSDKAVAIAVVAPQGPFEFYGDFWEGVWSAAYELAPLGVQVSNILLESLDADEAAVDELLRADLDGLVLMPSHTSRATELIERSAQRGVPVITVFNDAPASRRAVFVGPDHRLAGRLAAEMLAGVLPRQGRILILPGPQTDAHYRERYGGFSETLRLTRPQVAFSEFDTPGELLNELKISSANPSHGLFVGWADCAELGEILGRWEGAGRAVTFGLTEVTAVHLQRGTLCAVIDSSLHYQGYLAVQKAYECANAQWSGTRWDAAPSAVMLPAHVKHGGQSASTHAVMEAVLRERTRQLRHYQQELKLANDRLMRSAETDALTGLMNQRKFDEALDEVAASGVVLLVATIDEAQEISELLGESARDAAIKMVAGALLAACAGNEKVGRVGPGEFGILLTDRSTGAAHRLADRITQCVDEARMAADVDFELSVSIGIASAPLRGRTAAELRRAARSVLIGQLRKTG